MPVTDFQATIDDVSDTINRQARLHDVRGDYALLGRASGEDTLPFFEWECKIERYRLKASCLEIGSASLSAKRRRKFREYGLFMRGFMLPSSTKLDMLISVKSRNGISLPNRACAKLCCASSVYHQLPIATFRA
jgi:hypothetical protein